MKIRNGFVSNSSSCSFTLICPKDIFEKATKELHPYYQQWIKSELCPEEVVFLGEKVVAIQKHISTEDEEAIIFKGKYPKEAVELDRYDDEDEDSKPKKWVSGYNVMDTIHKKIKSKTDNVIYLTEGG